MSENQSLQWFDIFYSSDSAEEAFKEIWNKSQCLCRSCGLSPHLNIESLINFTYRPLGAFDESNNHFLDGEFYSSQEKKVFDITRTKFRSYSNQNLYPLENLRKLYVNDGPYNVPIGKPGLMGIEFMYRNMPVSWVDFTYLNPPVPCQSGNRRVAFIEHGEADRVTEDSLAESGRYIQTQSFNFKFGFFLKHMEITAASCGFYKQPRQFGDRTEWSQVWAKIRNPREKICDFVRRISVETNMDVMDYHKFLKADISTFYVNLRLDQPKIWNENESEYSEE